MLLVNFKLLGPALASSARAHIYSTICMTILTELHSPCMLCGRCSSEWVRVGLALTAMRIILVKNP